MIRLDLADMKCPPPRGLLEELKLYLPAINSYPSGDYPGLKLDYADYFGVSPSNITAWNGLDEAIDAITRVFGKSVCIYTPTFSQFELAAKRCNSKIKKVESLKEGRYEINPSASSKSSLTWICNPNNPTGTLTSRKIIEEVLSNSKGVVAVDEAYFEYSGESAVGLLNSYDNLLVLRGTSKGFGMAGLRLGFVISSEENARKLESIRQIFNVNSLAEACGKLVLKYKNYYAAKVEETKAIRDDFSEKLADLGVFVFPSSTNFVLARFSDTSERDFVVLELSLEEISVFSAGNDEFSGFSGPYIRFAIGSESDMEAAISCIERALSKNQVKRLRAISSIRK